MGWTDPRTWVADETLTDALMNTHVRDNLDWLANDHPRCRGNRSGAQLIADSTSTPIAFSTADTFDVGAMHDPTTNNTRFTVPSAGDGLYHIEAYGSWDGNTVGGRSLILRLNGTEIVWQTRVPGAVSASGFPQNISGYRSLVAADYIELDVNQNSGGNLNFSDVHLVIKWTAF